MADEVKRYKFTAEQYSRLQEIGVLTPEQPVKLLRGLLYFKRPPANHAPDAGRLKRYTVKFTVDDYMKMAEVGILAPDERVELIDGVIVEMAPTGDLHALIVVIINQLLVTRTLGLALVSPQNPLRVAEGNARFPDFTLLKLPRSRYHGRLPEPEDVLLLIEVSDSTIRIDRSEKLVLYARSGIAEYWIVNLDTEVVEVYRQPQGDTYREISRHGRGDSLTIQALPEVRLTVDELLA